MTAEAARMSRRLPTLVRRRDSPASSTRSYAPTTMNAARHCRGHHADCDGRG